jgi:hypothetical protein
LFLFIFSIISQNIAQVAAGAIPVQIFAFYREQSSNVVLLQHNLLLIRRRRDSQTAQ